MSNPFSAERMRKIASFRRLTGITVASFDTMRAAVKPGWDAAQRRKGKSGRPCDTGGLEDHLLIMLIYYRCSVTQQFIGYFYAGDRSAICRAIKRIEVLVKPLYGIKREPRLSAGAAALIVDCTEQPVQRPKDAARQHAYYSGKKKQHTIKTEYIVTTGGRIASVSPSHPGSRHDVAVRRDGPPLPAGAHL